MSKKITFKGILGLFEEGCLALTECAVKKQTDEQLKESYKKLKYEGGNREVLKIVRKEMMRRRLI